MKPYSRRELLGLLVLATLCVLSLTLGIMSRQRIFSTPRHESPVSVEKGVNIPDSQNTTDSNKFKTSVPKNSSRSKSVKRRGGSNKGTKSKKPTAVKDRDMLRDTVPR